MGNILDYLPKPSLSLPIPKMPEIPLPKARAFSPHSLPQGLLRQLPFLKQGTDRLQPENNTDQGASHS